MKLPVMEAAQVRLDPPEPPVMLVEERVQERLDEFVVTVRVTVPVKPLTGIIVMADVPAVPCVAVTVVGFATIVKSGCAAVVT